MTLLCSFRSSWETVQACLILLRFPLSCFTDVAKPSTSKKITTCFIAVVWIGTHHISEVCLYTTKAVVENLLNLALPRTPRSQPLGLSYYAFLRILHSNIKWGNGNKPTFLVSGKARGSVSRPARGFAVLAICILLSAKTQLNARGLDPLNLYQGRA